jgi:glutamate dehydrogenase
MRADHLDNKQLLLEKIKTALADRTEVSAAKQAALYCDVFFKRVPVTGLSEDTPEKVASMVISQLEFLRQRKAGDLSIRVFNPDKERDGWDCQHTVVEMSNDDMPFLVDTSSMAMQELNLGVHLIVHPIFNVERDSNGKLKSFHPRSTTNSVKESFIHIHLDKQTEPAALASVEK